jgi:anti-anti-sigma factor
MRLQVREHDRILVLHISGNLVCENTDELETAWANVLVKNPETVAIDCVDITSMDSVAVGFLVKVRNDSHEHGIHLILLEPNRSIKNLFAIARLEDYFTFSTKSDFKEQYAVEI